MCVGFVCVVELVVVVVKFQTSLLRADFSGVGGRKI